MGTAKESARGSHDRSTGSLRSAAVSGSPMVRPAPWWASAVGDVLVAGVVVALFAVSPELRVAQQRAYAEGPVVPHDDGLIDTESVAADRAAQPLGDHRVHRGRITQTRSERIRTNDGNERVVTTRRRPRGDNQGDRVRRRYRMQRAPATRLRAGARAQCCAAGAWATGRRTWSPGGALRTSTTVPTPKSVSTQTTRSPLLNVIRLSVGIRV